MASLCKSQQCSIERRGFRQELDSWRYKLIHCVGFESILEGLFGPGLLKDLSLFKDCEPTGVCDWSFDENCLFCCLRREKVKEHLAGFNKSVSETGQENLLKQEQAKIIRLERQAEEFINAVFYKKDSPRISDPNIPLVAREIMQRMIRQFAAEYTSKNSSTQDSSQPNSTKNQSLPNSPSGQSSPPPATTQNPVLSKLLMADQDSPLDLTVKKSQSEEPCEQADGVLDLSTKKSPSSGSTPSSISPSTSNAIGNGIQNTEGKALDPCNSTSLTLEKFMVKLCAHHRKQFLLVLNGLCTEESFKNSKTQSASVSDVKISNVEEHSPCVSDLCTKEISIQPDSLEASINAAVVCADMEICHREVAQKIELVKPQDLGIEENSVTEITFLNNCSPSTCHYQENLAKKHILHVKPTEDNSQLLQSDETGCITKSEPLQTDFSESCVLSHSNLTLTPVTGAQEAEFHINLPKCADKENSQCISPRQANLDKDSDSNVKHNSVHTVVVTKLGNHLNNYDSFQAVTENALSNLHKIKSQENIKSVKSAKRCKNSPSLRTNDCDNQCDVVYISEPITAQYHLQHQKSFLYTRNTARKSTRGYLFNEECCQLSTVRTLVRSSKVEDRGNCSLHFAEALIIPDGTLPLTDVSLDHSKEPCLGIGTVDSLSQNGTPDPPTGQESCSTDELSSVVEQSVSDSLLAVLSLVHEKDKSPCFSIPSPPHNILQNRPVDVEVQGDIGKLHADHLEKCSPEVTHSCESVNEDKNVTLTSLDVGLTESLKDRTVLSEHKNVEEIAANECFSQTTIKQEKCRVSSISSSVFTHSNEVENSEMTSITPFCLPSQKNFYTLESSMEMPEERCLDTVSNGRIENTFEDSTSDILQKDANCSNHVTLEPDVKNMIIENSSSISVKKNKHFITEQQFSENDCAHVKPTYELELTKEATDPMEALIWPTTSNHVDNISTENIYELLDTCAKVCQPNDCQCKDVSVTEQDVQPCHSDTSFEHAKKINIENSSQTKEIHGAKNFNATKLGMLENLLPSNNINGKISIASKKKFKKTHVPSDRRLRSREPQTDTCVMKKASLHVQISPCSSSKSSYRSVEFSTECATPHGNLTQINFEENNGENNFVQFLSDQLAKDKLLLSERMFKNTISITPKPLENVSIHFEIGSNQRKVFFCSESKTCFKVEGEDSPGVLKNDCPFKFKKCSKEELADRSISFARTRSKAKCVEINSLTEHKEKGIKAEKVEHLYVENKQPLKCKKSYFTNLESSKDKEIIRPKFIDWCFEEESQERISSLNNKYCSVHNNWISLEKDVSVGPKSKNKADKLKEIWKTKKRVRKAKTIEEAQRYSPMQMLFMNSYKFSDICRWFLETTETKSLVIVKKLNTRLPEEHLLPVLPVQKPSIASLYPHTLQAERLKKHLKKFASVYPACSNSKTQNAILKLNKVQVMETSTISVKGACNSKNSGSKIHTNKPTSAHILRKYNRFREKLHQPSPTLNEKHKATTSQNSAAKMDSVKDIRMLSSSKLNTHSSTDPHVCKVEINDEKQKARKRPKDDQSLKPGVQKTKRRKTEVKQELDKKRHSIVRKALPTKKINCKSVRSDNNSKLQAPKKQEVNNIQMGKASVLKKGKTKSAMQKKISKTQLVQKCQTRSSKLRPVPPVLSEQRITRTSQPWMKAFHRKLYAGSKTTKKTQLVEKKKNRSRTDSSTQSR